MKSRSIAAALLIVPLAGWGQTRAQFDVASLKPNKGCDTLPRVGNIRASEGRLDIACANLQTLIQTAYGTFGDGVAANPQALHIEGGPAWMQSEFYSMEAKSDGPVRTELLAGPMLQALLEERFHLKVHRETRETPVYAMTVARSGLKVTPLAEGGCTPIDSMHPPPLPKPGEPPPNLCGTMLMGRTGKGDTMMIELRGVTMTQVAQRLSGRFDRSVVNRTGIEGKYKMHVEYTPDPAIRGQVPSSEPPDTQVATPPNDPGPNLFAALQEQIGLKLTPDKGPVEYLVIDRVEKPSAN